eukprot:152508_1
MTDQIHSEIQSLKDQVISLQKDYRKDQQKVSNIEKNINHAKRNIEEIKKYYNELRAQYNITPKRWNDTPDGYRYNSELFSDGDRCYFFIRKDQRKTDKMVAQSVSKIHTNGKHMTWAIPPSRFDHNYIKFIGQDKDCIIKCISDLETDLSHFDTVSAIVRSTKGTQCERRHGWAQFLDNVQPVNKSSVKVWCSKHDTDLVFGNDSTQNDDNKQNDICVCRECGYEGTQGHVDDHGDSLWYCEDCWEKYDEMNNSNNYKNENYYHEKKNDPNSTRNSNEHIILENQIECGQCRMQGIKPDLFVETVECWYCTRCWEKKMDPFWIKN